MHKTKEATDGQATSWKTTVVKLEVKDELKGDRRMKGGGGGRKGGGIAKLIWPSVKRKNLGLKKIPENKSPNKNVKPCADI
jgi:hypothetical protein